MPDLLDLRLEGFNHMGMAMADRGHRNARTEIEISLAAFRDQPNALASFEAQGGSGKRIEQRPGFGGSFGHGDITPYVKSGQTTVNRARGLSLP